MAEKEGIDENKDKPKKNKNRVFAGRPWSGQEKRMNGIRKEPPHHCQIRRTRIRRRCRKKSNLLDSLKEIM